MTGALTIATLLSPFSLTRTVRADSGDIEQGFGENGDVWNPFGDRIAIQPDGKLVAAMGHAGKLRLSRYFKDGELEWRKSVTSISAGVFKVLIRPDGKILVAYLPDGFHYAVTLVTTNGERENTFGLNGVLGTDEFKGVAVMPDNRLVILHDTQFKVYDPKGVLLQTVVSPYPSTSIFGEVAVGPDGRVVVASDHVLTRYNSDLTPDSSFCGGGPCTTPVPTIWTLAVANDGKIVVVADGSTMIARHLPNGDVDFEFGTSGVAVIAEPHYSDDVRVSRLQIDDKGRVLVSLHEPGDTDSVWVVDAAGSSVHEMTQSQTRLLENYEMVLQQDGKLVLSGFISPEGRLMRRFHYDDEGRAADLQIDTFRITPVRAVNPGDEITFDIRVTNNGKSKAGYLTFENRLSHGTEFVSFESPQGWVTYQRPKGNFGRISCSGYSLGPGSSVTFSLRVRVSNLGQVNQVRNTATIRSLVQDPIISNNVTSVAVAVQ